MQTLFVNLCYLYETLFTFYIFIPNPTKQNVTYHSHPTQPTPPHIPTAVALLVALVVIDDDEIVAPPYTSPNADRLPVVINPAPLLTDFPGPLAHPLPFTFLTPPGVIDGSPPLSVVRLAG